MLLLIYIPIAMHTLHDRSAHQCKIHENSVSANALKKSHSDSTGLHRLRRWEKGKTLHATDSLMHHGFM